MSEIYYIEDSITVDLDKLVAIGQIEHNKEVVFCPIFIDAPVGNHILHISMQIPKVTDDDGEEKTPVLSIKTVLDMLGDKVRRLRIAWMKSNGHIVEDSINTMEAKS